MIAAARFTDRIFPAQSSHAQQAPAADGVATIVGGRNIGDEYFGATDGLVFADLDNLAVGPAATDVAHDFDRYWASPLSRPVRQTIAVASPARRADLERAAQAVRQNSHCDRVAHLAGTSHRRDPSARRDAVARLARTRLVSDDPAKALDLTRPHRTIVPQLRDMSVRPAANSTWFCPTSCPARLAPGTLRI